jgi:hypothetical protein
MNFKKHRILKTLAALMLLFIGWIVYQVFIVDNSIRVSRETTHWTEPLNERGMPDFGRIVLDSQRQGVTPENNGAIPFWRAIWPGELNPQMQRLLTEELQMEMPDRDGLTSRYDVDLMPWLLAERGLADESTADRTVAPQSEDFKTAELDATRIADLATSQPWTAELIPPLAVWVEENQPFFDLLVEASRKPQFYSPSPSHLGQSDEMLASMVLPGVNKAREASRSLVARAMFAIGSGDYETAWTHIDAVYGLADLLDVEHATLVEVLVRITLQGVADDATTTLLSQPDLPGPLAERILADLSARPPIDSVAEALDNAERMVGLDTIIRESQGEGALASVGGGPSVGAISRVFDWNLVLTDMNRWYDRLTEASRMPTGDERDAAYQKIDADLKQIQMTPGKAIGAVVSKKTRSRLMTDMLAATLLPAVAKANAAQDRIKTQTGLIRLSAALAVYRAEHGAYPDSLAALTPDILPSLPVDSYHGAEFIYARNAAGFLLYSVGENGVDDGANHRDSNIYQGYPLVEDISLVLLEALGERLREDPTREESMDEAARQAVRALSNGIPQSADDLSIRLPRLPSPWPIEPADESAPPGE